MASPAYREVLHERFGTHDIPEDLERDILARYVEHSPPHVIAEDLDLPIREVRGVIERHCGFDFERARQVLGPAEPADPEPIGIQDSPEPATPTRGPLVIPAHGGPLVDPILAPTSIRTGPPSQERAELDRRLAEAQDLPETYVSPARPELVPGLSYSRLNYWVKKGWIRANKPAYGLARTWPPGELDIAARMRELVDDEGWSLADAAAKARSDVLGQPEQLDDEGATDVASEVFTYNEPGGVVVGEPGRATVDQPVDSQPPAARAMTVARLEAIIRQEIARAEYHAAKARAELETLLALADRYAGGAAA